MNVDVTVVLPTISSDSWFDQAVRSVLAQDAVALQLHIIYDGIAPSSADWSGDARISTSIHPERVGLVRGLREAFAKVETPFVARLDADDLAEPQRLRAQLDFMNANPDVGLLGSEAIRIDESGRTIGIFGAAVGDDIRPRLIRSNPVVHSAVMIRTQAYHAAGGFDTRMTQMEDYDLWLRIAQRFRVASLPEPLVSYRLHPNQVSRGAKPYGYHINKIRRERSRLGRALGASRLATTASSAAWEAGQLLRYYGLRKPGYDGGTDHSG
jgi:glycosyltransferase involved in cell wall biosynthesis